MESRSLSLLTSPMLTSMNFSLLIFSTNSSRGHSRTTSSRGLSSTSTRFTVMRREDVSWMILIVGMFVVYSTSTFCLWFSFLLSYFLLSIAASPAFPGLRRFKEGRNYKQWTGNDSRALMKVCFSVLHCDLCLISPVTVGLLSCNRWLCT